MNRLTFGKYKDLSINEVYSKDLNYLEWLNTQPWYQIKFKESREQLIEFLNLSNNHDFLIMGKNYNLQMEN